LEEFKFNSLEDLYKKVLPALNTKVADLTRNNIKHIKENDIFDYLKKYYWVKSEKLSLGEIVHDILSTPNNELEAYYLKKNQQKVAKEKEDLL